MTFGKGTVSSGTVIIASDELKQGSPVLEVKYGRIPPGAEIDITIHYATSTLRDDFGNFKFDFPLLDFAPSFVIPPPGHSLCLSSPTSPIHSPSTSPPTGISSLCISPPAASTVLLPGAAIPRTHSLRVFLTAVVSGTIASLSSPSHPNFQYGMSLMVPFRTL